MKHKFLDYAIDVERCGLTPPDPFDFVLPGLDRGDVGVLIAPSGIGASTWALEAACAVASQGADLLELNLENHGGAVYLSTNDDGRVLHHRLHEVFRAVPKPAWDQVAERLTPAPIVGCEVSVLDAGLQDAIVDAGKGARLIVLDTLRGIDQRDEMRAIRALEDVAHETGAAVVFILTSDRGIFSDEVRWVAGLSQMSGNNYVHPENGQRIDAPEYYVRFSIDKQNNCAPFNPVWYGRTTSGLLQPMDIESIEHWYERTGSPVRI